MTGAATRARSSSARNMALMGRWERYLRVVESMNTFERQTEMGKGRGAPDAVPGRRTAGVKAHRLVWQRAAAETVSDEMYMRN